MRMYQIVKTTRPLSLLTVFLVTACGAENPLSLPSLAQAQAQAETPTQEQALAQTSTQPPQTMLASPLPETPEAPIITPVNPDAFSTPDVPIIATANPDAAGIPEVSILIPAIPDAPGTPDVPIITPANPDAPGTPEVPIIATENPDSPETPEVPIIAPVNPDSPETPDAPVTTPETPGEPAEAQPDPLSLPRAQIEDFEFIGGFRLPAKEYGDTSMNYAKGVIEQSGNSLFIVGHRHQDKIAEFLMPELVNSEVISELEMADDPVQLPVSVLDAASTGNTQGMDEITGLEVIDGQLIINAMEYYDAPADNSHTTLIADNAFELVTSQVGGYYELQGAAHAGGWLSPIPPEWQATLAGDYLTGHSSGEPIISRLSVGPSAFVVTSADLSQANAGDPEIATTTLMDFSLERPLHEDLFNDSRSNDLWTHTSNAVYGFIVPGTRTYATFGYTSGVTSGIGYKITQDDGSLCPGYCSYEKSDQYNYYWLWDMSDLVAVKDGQRAADSIRPYAYGEFDVPYQTSDTVNRIGGASFDESTATLLFSVLAADNEQGEYTNPPVIAGYQLNLQ